MRIEATVWHARLYMWGQRFWKTFASSREDIDVSARTNICQYVRVVVLALAALAAYFCAAAYLSATFIYYPSVYFGWDYWSAIGKIVACVIAAAIIIVCLALANIGWGELVSWWKKKHHATAMLEGFMEGTPDRPSIVAVAKKYVEAHTDGFCTAIEIVAPAARYDESRNRSIGAFNVYVPVAANSSPEPNMLLRGEGSVFTTEVVTKETPIAQSVLIQYITASRIKFLPVWWLLVIAVLTSSLCLSSFNQIHESILGVEAVWEGECTVGKWSKNNDHLALSLTCDGKAAEVTDTETIFSYLNDKKAPRCFADKHGQLYCDPVDKKRMKKV